MIEIPIPPEHRLNWEHELVRENQELKQELIETISTLRWARDQPIPPLAQKTLDKRIQKLERRLLSAEKKTA